MIEYVLKRKSDGMYLAEHHAGRVQGVSYDAHDAVRYAERGAKSARGWLLEPSEWEIVPVRVTVVEVDTAEVSANER